MHKKWKVGVTVKMTCFFLTKEKDQFYSQLLKFPTGNS